MPEFKTLEQITKASQITASEQSTDTNRINATESVIESLVIIKDGIKFNLIPWDAIASVRSPLDTFVINENMFSGPLMGSMTCFDIRNWVDELAIGDGSVEAELEIKFKIKPNSKNVNTVKFTIYNSQRITDEAQTSELMPGNERVSIWRFDFMDSSFYKLKYRLGPGAVPNDRVFALSTKTGGSGASQTENNIPGFINHIYDNYLKSSGQTINIDQTYNGIWSRGYNFTNPNMKSKIQNSILGLLEYAARNADTQKQENVFWWQDLSSWNFKAVPSKVVKIDVPVDGFVVTTDETSPNKILSLEVLSEYNTQKFHENNWFTNFVNYPTVNPILADDSSNAIIKSQSYQNLYSDFIDIVGGVTTEYSNYLLSNNTSTNGSTFGLEYQHKIDNDYYELYLPENIGGTAADFQEYYDDVYGYFSEVLNQKNTEWEEYSILNPKWLKTLYQAPYDVSPLPYEYFYTIHEKIRKPLLENRNRYAYLKNIKRKWEVFRCTVCCHENGALGSKEDIEIFKNPGPVTGYTYNALFGPTGIFADMDQSYKIAAAGSFTDLLNYDSGNTFYQRGLTYSYDLTKYPYNQTIGQFFNLFGPEPPEDYVKFVIDRASRQYDIAIDKLNTRINILKTFVNERVEIYKTIADSIFTQATNLEKNSSIKRPIDLLKTGIQGRYVGDAIVKENIPEWPITSYEFGMVPASSIPENKGFAQIVLGTDPNLNAFSFNLGSQNEERNLNSIETLGSSITFRNSSLITNTETDSNNENNTFRGIATCENTKCCCTNGIPGAELQCLPPIITQTGDCSCALYQFSPYFLTCNQIASSNCDDCTPPPLQYTRYRCKTDQSSLPTDGLQQCEQFITTNPSEGFADPSECSFYCAKKYRCIIEPRDDGSISRGCTACSWPDDCNFRYGEEPFFTSFENCSEFCANTPAGGQGGQGPTGPSALPQESDVRYIDPSLLIPCSTDSIVRGYIKYVNSASSAYSPIYLYAAPYLWDYNPNNVDNWIFHDYGTDSDLIPSVPDPGILQETRSCLTSGNCYNTTCLSAVALEVLKRTCVAEIELLTAEKELYIQLKQLVSDTFKNKWKESYKQWYNRNAFFFSKIPGQNIFKSEEKETVSSQISLQNIKSITRKEIRGSRYELLANRIGVTGASAGQWVYDIFFGGNSGSTLHPYYDQGYTTDSFITSRNAHKWISFTDSDSTDNPDGQAFGQFGPQFKGQEYSETSVIHIGEDDISDLINVESFGDLKRSQTDLNYTPLNTPINSTFRFYNTNDPVTEKQSKPPNLKKEQITSYVRVEFNNPIGLDRIREFPNGFIRDAGSEYFLPYLVQLTPGPFGRQGVKYNCAVIGMDPYGFDVAVKKIKDDLPTNRKLQGIDKGNYYDWWNHDTGSFLSKAEYLTNDYNGMDLWPEVGFETQYPYYSYDPTQEDMHSGGYDLDFHMGGAYYFEDGSQEWTESLYHYGMSSGKQFDQLYRTSVLGSYILPNSYRKLKPHRSWWSFFVPRNLFIPIRFANMFKVPNTKARDLFGGKAIFTISPNYWRTWYGSEFETWLSLSPNAKEMLTQKAPNLSFFVDDLDDKTSISAYSSGVSGIESYFTDSLMHYLSANYILYTQPGLVNTSDVWKYDLSGETEYGLTTPPVDTEYDFFDRNFAMQFVVYARGTRSCEDIGLKCINPQAIQNGVIQSAGDCQYDPYCKCPALYAIPTEEEPTYLELYEAYQKTKECALVEKHLGKDWLGCIWSDPNASCNCTCPEVGKYFPAYKAYMETYATFWGTRPSKQLEDIKSRLLLERQKVKIEIPPNENIKINSIVELVVANDVEETTHKFKRISGKWRVTGINHKFKGTNFYAMSVILVRDGLENAEEYKTVAPKGTGNSKR